MDRHRRRDALEGEASARRGRGTCAWCGLTFLTIVDLLDHVDRGHLPPGDAPAGPVASPVGGRGPVTRGHRFEAPGA